MEGTEGLRIECHRSDFDIDFAGGKVFGIQEGESLEFRG
jgi:hypothetical protein